MKNVRPLMEARLDVECFLNYFLIMITDKNGTTVSFDVMGKDQSLSALQIERLFTVLGEHKIEYQTFNGNGYDMPMCIAALGGATCERLKQLSDAIITTGLKPWEVYEAHGIKKPTWINHVDLIEVAPGTMTSLKVYGGRVHTRWMKDLPYPPETVLTPYETTVVRDYCFNDNSVTQDLAEELRKELDLRRSMSEEYGTDLRSKSDAQIAEAVLKYEYKQRTGQRPPKTKIEYRDFLYEAPDYIKFVTQPLKDVYTMLTTERMVINRASGHVIMPKAISDHKLQIGDTQYKIGLGGLHSQESEVTHRTTDEHTIIDCDVASYYPNLILNTGMAPPSFGKNFAPVYRGILERRLKAKARKNEDPKAKVEDATLKITLNGTFGKLANQYSLLYAPKMMIATTLTGQLSLLMLIEFAELAGIPVVSANTDGVVFKCPNHKIEDLRQLVKAWERRSNLEMEETQYRALHSRDVNNYIAIKTDGKAKRKGFFGESGLMKNPQNEVCADAVAAHLEDGTNIEEYVRSCTDIRKFVTVRVVRGGAIKDDELIGKVVRWYYSTESASPITYKQTGNRVPRSFGAQPLMILPDELPSDLDYEWYINECYQMLMSLGAMPYPVLEKIPRKNSKAWKKLHDQGKLQPTPDGKKWEWNDSIKAEALALVLQSYQSV